MKKQFLNGTCSTLSITLQCIRYITLIVFNCIIVLKNLVFFTASYIKKLSRRTCTKDTHVMSFRLVGRERRLTIPEEGRQPMKFGRNIAFRRTASVLVLAVLNIYVH